MTWLWFILAGFLVGTISGLIGIGGGALFVPLFIYGMKMDIYHAVGTSLAVIVPVALFGAFSHALKGHVTLAPVLSVALGAVLGAFLSGQWIHLVPEAALRRGLALFLIFVAVKLLLK